jgi:hypothetical protein
MMILSLKTPSAGVTAASESNMIAIDDRNWPPLRPYAVRLFKPRRRLEAEILVLRHQLNIL